MTNPSLYFQLTAYIFIPSPSPHRRCTHLSISLFPTVYTHTLYSSPLFIYDYRCSIIVCTCLFIPHCVYYIQSSQYFATLSLHMYLLLVPIHRLLLYHIQHIVLFPILAQPPPRTWLSCFIYIMIYPLPLLMYLCIFL